jgi:glycosyltransferase involved in cell wall biosynthesis
VAAESRLPDLTPARAPRASLVVITYNWPGALARVLDSVAQQSRLPDEVIVTDDGSTDDTRALVARIGRDFPTRIAHVWQADTGFRAARARNRGIAASRGDYVILIDGDMILHRDFVADHLDFALRGHSLQGSRLNASAAETKRLLDGGRARFSPLMPGPFPPHRAIRWPWLARVKARSSSGGRIFSCNMSAWRDDLLLVNGFDERFEGYGGEDQELAKRLRHAGVRRRQLKFAGLAIHLHHNTRAPDDPNDASLPANRMIAETLATHAVRCERGVDGHLAEFAEPPPDLRGAQ